MVGDTMTDVRFARNAGMNVIGVGKAEEARNRLAPHADAVAVNVSEISGIISKMEKRVSFILIPPFTFYYI